MKYWLSDLDVTINNGMGIAVHMKAGVEQILHPMLHEDALAAGVKEVKAEPAAEEVAEEKPSRRSRKTKAE